MSELYRVEVPKCRRWRQAHSQRQGLNREVPTEGSPRQTIDLTNRNGLRHMLSGKTAKQVEAQKHTETAMYRPKVHMGKSSFLPEENSRTQANRLGGVKLAVSGQQTA